MINYLILSTCVCLYLGFIWSRRSLSDIFIKNVLLGTGFYGLWTMLILKGYIVKLPL